MAWKFDWLIECRPSDPLQNWQIYKKWIDSINSDVIILSQTIGEIPYNSNVARAVFSRLVETIDWGKLLVDSRPSTVQNDPSIGAID